MIKGIEKKGGCSMIKLNVYLKFNGQAEEAMFFYKDA
jgi:hypothetical protein